MAEHFLSVMLVDVCCECGVILGSRYIILGTINRISLPVHLRLENMEHEACPVSTCVRAPEGV